MKLKTIYEPLPQGTMIQATRAVADAAMLNQPKPKGSWTVNIFSKGLKRSFLALAIGAALVMLPGCISVHKTVEQPSPVIVVPQDHPNP